MVQAVTYLSHTVGYGSFQPQSVWNL